MSDLFSGYITDTFGEYFENAKAAYKVINCKDAACNTVLSLVSVLGSEEDCPLAECLMFLEPQPKMGAIRGFSSSG